MHREILIACLPYVAWLVGSVAVACLLVRLSGARWSLSQLRRLHRDELGGVQSLSFVVTLPLFIIVMMFIVQLSQLTIAKFTVEYAAFAAARCAMVWIPANVSEEEPANCISMLSPQGSESGEGETIYHIYHVEPEGEKFDRIHLAAAMACLPICPSRDVHVEGDHPSNDALDSLRAAYRAMSPGSADNEKIPTRIRNKLAYALASTKIETIEIRHKEDHDEPALGPYILGPDDEVIEFRPNEIGWQDQITATITHQFALLPGPARILARRAESRPGTSAEEDPGDDSTAQQIERQGDVYVYEITATARLSNEGQKSAKPYYQPARGD